MNPLFRLQTPRFAIVACSATMFAVFCSLSVVVQAQIRTAVRVNQESTLETERISLGSISSVSGDADATERISSISLGYAPNIGTSREIRREQILLAIKAAGFSEKEVVFESPETVIVRRSGQSLSPEAIRETVETSLLTGLRSQKIEARLVRLDISKAILVPAGSIEMRVNASSVRNLFAPFSVGVEVRVDGRLVRTFAVMAEIEAFANVLVAAKDLSSGTAVTEGDVRFEKLRLDRPVTAYLRDPKALRGVAATREVRSGSPLTSDLLASVAVIKPGDPVRIEAGTDKLRIVVNGEARAGGRIGDRIAVKNSQTGTILQAYIVEKGVVKIAL